MMKLNATLLAVTLLLGTAGTGLAKNAQQNKMTTCNAEAAAKHLKGADREAFMKSCLSTSSEAAAAKPPTAQQRKMKACNTEAGAESLTGAERKAFMKKCLSGE